MTNFPINTSTKPTLQRAQMLVFSIALFGVWILQTAPLQALPQFSLMTGNRCLTCHITTQGGGIRGELGWYASKDVGMLKPKDIPLLKELYALDGESNSFFDNTLTFGMDLRAQYAQTARSTTIPGRFFPMQLSLHAAFTPTQWLTVEGTLNAATFWRRYAGQPAWAASVIIQPDYTLPQLRVGHFQPSIGMRYDDHTMLIRQVAGSSFPNGQPLIAPYYADWGAEINYDGLKWLSLTAGAFLPNNLAQSLTVDERGSGIPPISIISKLPENPTLQQQFASPTLLGRALVWLRTEDHALNGHLGASVLNNGTFTLINAFAGAGLTDALSLMGEYALSGIKDGRQTRNYSVELTYRPFSWLYPFVRYEYGTTRQAIPGGIGDYYTRQIVGGVQWFVLPYIELRPEVRYVETEAYSGTRFAAQIHIFY
ncbi:MAG: hypothetical protein EAZ92_02265 [Candidatus Kapaibacterium sp.]|nr:MAG: hypothetical protein EAZ92_02265 [Candidatus Kapabacteria bacterium]